MTAPALPLSAQAFLAIRPPAPPHVLPARFQAALDRARSDQFADDPATADRAARMFRRLRRTPTFRAYLSACQARRQDRESDRLLRLWT